ncbi:hypothetical protein NQ317_019704 [Molorchus minor]|uniref:Cathepsin propeptide inhibitor domain-containing protein n=1 Tax=Molorchus minor TaxID=1323400 RepID=A0ABQ9JR07_9CUCU|nr:hypothetical protein NQ317_019704 [Molorchus minor]
MQKTTLILFLCIIAIMAMPISIEDQWKEFKTKHGKNYDSKAEEDKRFDIFKKNVDKVEEHNKKYDAGEVSYTQGINQFSDLTTEEFRSKYLGGIRIPKQKDEQNY